MTKCVFCGRESEPFRGIHLITNDGAIRYYCSSKCRKNALKLRRDKRKLKWTEAYRISLAKARAAEVASRQQSTPQAAPVTPAVAKPTRVKKK